MSRAGGQQKPPAAGPDPNGAGAGALDGLFVELARRYGSIGAASAASAAAMSSLTNLLADPTIGADSPITAASTANAGR